MIEECAQLLRPPATLNVATSASQALAHSCLHCSVQLDETSGDVDLGHTPDHDVPFRASS